MATEKRLIKKLPTGSTSNDGIWWEKHPTREDVIKKIDEIIEVLNTLLEERNAVEAVEVVHGRWEKSEPGYSICSYCKADVAIFSDHRNYYPNCGAKMDGDVNV